MESHRQLLSLREVAKLLRIGKSTLFKRLSGTSIEGVIRDNKNICIDPAAIQEIKILLEYNDEFDNGNYLSTNEVAKYLKSLGINAKRTDINNWIRNKKIPTILHMGFRYIEEKDCFLLGQTIKDARIIPAGFCSVEEAANIIDVSPGTIARWASDGEIKSKFVIINHYKRLYVASDKLSEVKLKRKLNGLKNLLNSDIESLKKLKATSSINPTIKETEKLDTTQNWLTTGEAEQRLNIKYKTIQTYLRKGKFPNAVKVKNVWYIPENDVLNYGNPQKPKLEKARAEDSKFVLPEGFMKLDKASELLRAAKGTVYKMIHRGIFPTAQKVNGIYWIIAQSDIEQYQNNKKKPKLEKARAEDSKFVLPEGFMKLDKVSELLRVTKNTVYKMIHRGIFPTAQKVNSIYWIIAQTDIEQYQNNKKKTHVSYEKHQVIQEFLYYLESVKVPHIITNTYGLYKDYAKLRLNATGGRANNLRRVLNHIKKLFREVIQYLPFEIFKLPEEEIENILKNPKYSNPIRENFIMFLKYSYHSMGIHLEREFMFSRKHKSNETKKDEIYSPDIYQRYEHHVKQIEVHIQKAMTDRYYANMWVLVTMLLTNAWRPSDIVFEMPRLDIDVISVNSLGWFQQCKLSLQECQMIINQLYLKLHDVNVSKSPNATLHFLVAPDMVECLATACVLSEIHCRQLEQSILEDKKRLLGTFIVGSQPETVYAITSGQVAHMKFFETDSTLLNFSSRKLNNSTMTYLFLDITEDDQDSAELAIEVPKWTRSHEDVNTTAVYIKVTNKDGSVDRVAINLFKRGLFGWLYNYMVRLACTHHGTVQSLEERTTTIQTLQDEYSPLQLEEWAKSLLLTKQSGETIIQRLSKMHRDTLQKLVINIYKGKMPSRDGCGQCLQFPGCVNQQRKTCIGCPEFIPQVQEVITEAVKEFYRLIESVNTSQSDTIIRRDSIFLLNILVLFQEAARNFGVETINGFIPVDQRKTALASIADKISIDQGAATYGVDKRFAPPWN